MNSREKWQVYAFSQANPSSTRAQIVEWVQAKLGKIISEATVTRIKQKYEGLRKEPEYNQQVKRPRATKYPAFDNDMKEWFLRMEKHINLSDALVISHAETLRDEKYGLSKDDLALSHGWLASFKKRLGIKSYYIHGEAGSVDLNAIKPQMDIFREKILQYGHENVYNLDETGCSSKKFVLGYLEPQ